ncbi:transposase [Caballeronia sordidicola]|uniref:transposase n=1 Tax=Caballeronia sordidicola TaxID=196367 RepID=UPI00094CACDB|nr:transposase [Caballeronia sordidicola]
MWTSATRQQYSRKTPRYETDLTDEEWAVVAPFLPVSPVRGRPHKQGMHEVVSAILYVLRGGIAWRLLPREFRPKSTVCHRFSIFRETCPFERINHALVIPDREWIGGQPSPKSRDHQQSKRRNHRAWRPTTTL